MAFTKYNAKQDVVTVNGVHITGLAEKFWSFSKKEALREVSTGAQGDVVSSEQNDPIWEASVTVQATSPQANFLFSLKDETEPFPIWNINKQLKRKEGGSQAIMTECPSDEREKNAGELEFKFAVIDGNITETE